MSLLACCGINCEACSFKLAREDNDARHLQPMPSEYDDSKSANVSEITPCPGCKGDSECGDCKIKDCFMEKAKTNTDWISCADCDDFCCETLIEFAHDGIPHHFDAIENLKFIKEQGLYKFANEQDKKFICKSCGKKLSWYLTVCPDCNQS